MSSFNRIFELIDTEEEAPDYVPFDEAHPYFPETGVIDFVNVFMKYRDELDHTLKGLTFRIENGQKVGFVGRTGAGKSSII